MRPKLILSLCSFLLWGCASAPINKPLDDLCELDIPSAQGVCAGLRNGAVTVWRVPLSDLDKWSARSPESNARLKNYLHALESK